jgi:TolA-binding protein
MNTNVFVVFSLCITLGLSYLYTELREFYSPAKRLSSEVHALEEKIREERFKRLLLSYEFQDFRNEVATVLPKAIRENGGDEAEKTFPMRSLASVVQSRSNENLNIEKARIIFSKAKKYFRDKKYSEASSAFANLIKSHPYSADLPEAMFLLVESQYQLHHLDICISWINQMIELYPDNELTGYAMVRLGKIFESQERHEEALDIYRTVLKSFPQRELAAAADNALRTEQL